MDIKIEMLKQRIYDLRINKEEIPRPKITPDFETEVRVAAGQYDEAYDAVYEEFKGYMQESKIHGEEFFALIEKMCEEFLCIGEQKKEFVR